MKTFQRRAQTAITGASKVKTSKSWPRGCGLSMRHGGNFADRPKSTILMSPAFAVDICSIKFDQVADHHSGGFTVEIRLAPRGLFALENADCGTLPACQRGQFGKGFNRTHRQKLTLQRGAGKRGFDSGVLSRAGTLPRTAGGPGCMAIAERKFRRPPTGAGRLAFTELFGSAKLPLKKRGAS